MDEERHKAAIALNEKNLAVKNLQSRHFTLKGKGGVVGSDGEDGEEHSAIYHLIAAAQKKADLQREGDALEKDVLEKEREMIALTRTLQEMKERNTRHRLSFKKKTNDKTDGVEGTPAASAGTRAAKNKEVVNTKPPLSLQQLQHNVGGNDKAKKTDGNKAGANAKRGLYGGNSDLGLSLTATSIFQ